MDQQQWQKVNDIVDTALDLDEQDRATYIEKHCSGNKQLWRRVTELMESMEKADREGFLEGTAAYPEYLAANLSKTQKPASEFIGKTIDRYKITKLIGQGGMGVIYRAHDKRLGRPVALKFLPPHLSASSEADQRIAREARAAAKLDHPNIATIHEIGKTEQGHRFIAMAYYEGETLKKKIKRGPLSVDEALECATQIAEGLARAHEAGIVHRDVKPANVMMTERGIVKLLDFGLARSSDQSQLARPGKRMGTAAYMSPEQARGETVDGRTDLWGLGVVLYEMLAGERPFRGARDTAVAYAILHEEPTAVGDYRDEVSRELQTIVERCLQKNPEHRYASAEALLKDLRALHSSEDGISLEAWPANRTGTRHSRRQWFIGAAVAVVLALGVAVSWTLWPGSSANGSVSNIAEHSIAVLPFEVSGSAAETWRDGMVTVLSTGLDGAAGLRTIAERTVFAAWEDIDSALMGTGKSQALTTARRVGAEYAVAGSAVALGSEVRFTAEVYKTESGESLGKAQVRGSRDHVMALADALTRQVLGVLLKRSEEAIPSVDLASLTTKSLPAFKSFLKGERHLRTGEYEAAAEDFEAAIKRDSTFALAYARLAFSLWWKYGTTQAGIRAWKYAFRLSDQLPRRERRLVRAMYLYRIQDRPVAAANILRKLTVDYSDDPVIWYTLGEVLKHSFAPRDRFEVDHAFRQAVMLDPGHASYYPHYAQLGISVRRDSALAAHRIAAIPREDWKEAFGITLDLAFGSPRVRKDALDRLAGVSPLTIYMTGLWHVLDQPWDGKIYEKMLRKLVMRENSNYHDYNIWLFTALSFQQGQIEEGLTRMKKSEINEARASCLLAGSMSLGMPIPEDVARSYLEPSKIEDIATIDRLQCAGIYLIEQGRANELRPLFSRIREAAIPQESRKVRAMIDELKGYRAWRSGDFKQAAQLLSGKNQSGCWTTESACWRAIWRGNIQRALGHLKTAEEWYMAAWDHPVAHERLGWLYEEMGKPKKAKAAYRRFIQAWGKADATLQERVQAARERLKELSINEPL